MKMMGIGRLEGLASSSDSEVSGHVRALSAELENGRWKDASELRETYPQAEVHGAHATIHLDAEHCVVLLFDYDSQMVLVRSAGLSQSRRSSRRKSGSKP